MGKGKKKGGGKTTPIETSVSSLTLGEPSTSQPVEEEDSVGLTGGGRKTKQKPKVVEKVETVVEEKKPEPAVAAQQSKPEPPKPEQPKQEPPTVEESVGLGLPASKKSRPRKKKGQQAEQPPQSQPHQPHSEPSPGPPQTETQWAASGQQMPISAAATAPPPTSSRPTAAGTWQPPLPTARGPRGPAPPTAAGPRGPAPPTAAGPRGPAPPTAAGPRGPAPPTAAGPRGPAPPTAAGPRGPTPMTFAPRTAPSTSTQQGSAGDQTSTQLVPESRYARQKYGSCNYKIPHKIIGNSIRAPVIKVITNYLPMTIKPMKVYRYDIFIKPDRPKKMHPLAFKKVRDTHFPREMIAFDQVKNCFTLNALRLKNGDVEEFVVDVPDPNGKVLQFTVQIKQTGLIDLGNLQRYCDSKETSLSPPMEEIQCVDVILRQGALESYVKCGRQYFKRPSRPIDLTWGLEMWTGLFQSALFTSRPFLNIDVAHKGFPVQQPLIEAWKSFGLEDKAIEQQRNRGTEMFKDYLKNLKVVCKLVGPQPSGGQLREYICNGLVDAPTRMFFTNDQDGKTQSVFEYFANVKKYKIRYPALNCVWVGPRNKNIYYPIELCDVAYGQPLSKQLNEFQLSIMVREAATPPADRLRKIEECARSMNYSGSDLFKKFGLEISNKFFEVEAKVLTPPNLDCGEQNPSFPRRGAWNASKLQTPSPLTSWGLLGVELSAQSCNAESFIQLVTQTCPQLGMQVAQPAAVKFNVRMTELRSLLMSLVEKNIRLVFLIVPTRGKDYYHQMKQMAECDVGMLTQCIKEHTAQRKMNFQTLKNILLKVNSKLMGVNQVLDNRSMPRCLQGGGVMIVGADVTHPSPDQRDIPSIAAVTASIDQKCYIYNIELSIQAPKHEAIVQFEEMMVDHLKVYMERNNRRLPKKIYIYRDGVSEGQFNEIMNKELKATYEAYAKFTKDKPEILFLIVQKRHHTRLFGSDRRSGGIVNVEPGTVVDTHIVHPKELDFYLVSHQAIKGTARPTKYHSVRNDGNLPHDEVEQLTFYLCHLYSRCMRSVSYPTPTYYAHLACFRAKSLTHGTRFNNEELNQKPKRLHVCAKILKNSRMFFV